MTTPRDKRLHEQLRDDLTALRLTYILEHYIETLDEAARKNASMLEVLSLLIGGEAGLRAQRGMQRRIAQARLPKRKTLEDYNFEFPRKIPKQKVLRLFDCQFVAATRQAGERGQHECEDSGMPDHADVSR